MSAVQTKETNPHLPSWPKVIVENRGNCPIDFEIFDEAGEVQKFMWGDPEDAAVGRETNLQPTQTVTKAEWHALYARHGDALSAMLDSKKLTINRG